MVTVPRCQSVSGPVSGSSGPGLAALQCTMLVCRPGALKMQDVKMHDVKMTDQVART